MQMPAAVESFGDSEGQSESQLAVSENALLEAVALSGLWLNKVDVEEVLSEFLKITLRAMVKRRRSGSI